MTGLAQYELIEGDGGATLALSGPYLVSSIGGVDEDLRALGGEVLGNGCADTATGTRDQRKLAVERLVCGHQATLPTGNVSWAVLPSRSVRSVSGVG